MSTFKQLADESHRLKAVIIRAVPSPSGRSYAVDRFSRGGKTTKFRVSAKNLTAKLTTVVAGALKKAPAVFLGVQDSPSNLALSFVLYVNGPKGVTSKTAKLSAAEIIRGGARLGKKPAAKKKSPAKKTVRKTVQKLVYMDVPAGPPCGSCGKPKNAHLMKHRWVSATKKVKPRKPQKSVHPTKPEMSRAHDIKRLLDMHATGRPFVAQLLFTGTTSKGNQSQKVWELLGRANGYATIRWGKVGSKQSEQDLPIATAIKRAEAKLKKGYVLTRASVARKFSRNS